MLVIAGILIVAWPGVVDSIGASTSGTIVEKHEVVRVFAGDWFRHFEITASYSIPGRPMEHRAACDVTESTYDSLRQGNTVTVHYIPNLLVQPFVPATHLSPCTAMGGISLNTPVRHLGIALLALLPIVFLWRVLHIRSAAWLFLAWIGLTLAWVAMPRTEPEPRRRVPALATVHHVVTVTKLFESRNSNRDIPLQHPYQIVELQFVPPGMDTPVMAVDKVDQNSLPGLQEGQSLPIVYDAGNPRVARLVGGTRLFPAQARQTVLSIGIGFAILAAIGMAFSAFARTARRRVGI